MHAHSLRRYLAECIGTFVLVLFGLGVVHATVLTEHHGGELVWGGAVAAAIIVAGAISGAHLNPAITLAFAVHRRFSWRLVPGYIGAQVLGAFSAAGLVHLAYDPLIRAFEIRHGLVRGAPGSELSAMVYGEYFPNPMYSQSLGWSAEMVPEMTAIGVECFGTAVLAMLICAITEGRNRQAPTHRGAAFGIGMAVALLISVIAPLTQAGFNPARDFGPRVVAWLSGWGAVAIPGPRGGFCTVYILAPIVGAVLGVAVWRWVLAPALKHEPLSSHV